MIGDRVDQATGPPRDLSCPCPLVAAVVAADAAIAAWAKSSAPMARFDATGRRGVLLRGGMVRAALLALLWWVLTEGDPAGWWFGTPVVALATLASLALLPPAASRWRWRGALRFIAFFLWQSWRGGVDVAWRALDPRLPLDPQVLQYPLRLPAGLVRVLLVNTVSLLPGTLSADLRGDSLRVHALAGGPQVWQSLQRVEVAVAGLFGLALPPGATDEGRHD